MQPPRKAIGGWRWLFAAIIVAVVALALATALPLAGNLAAADDAATAVGLQVSEMSLPSFARAQPLQTARAAVR